MSEPLPDAVETWVTRLTALEPHPGAASPSAVSAGERLSDAERIDLLGALE